MQTGKVEGCLPPGKSAYTITSSGGAPGASACTQLLQPCSELTQAATSTAENGSTMLDQADAQAALCAALLPLDKAVDRYRCCWPL